MLDHHSPKELLSWFHWEPLIVPSPHQVALIDREGIRILHTCFATAPKRLSRFAESIMRKVSIVSRSAEKWIDSFPCPLLLSLHLDNGVVARKIGPPLSSNSIIIFSAIWSQILCGLFSSTEDHFFSEPGQINDHCPIPNFLASMETTSTFAKHSSSSLPLLSQEMSLNIDINRTVPVKFSGVSPKMLSKLLTSPQSCNVSKPGKMFHSNSVGSPLIPSVSVALRSCDPSYPVLPSFVGLRILMNPSKTQHRIWKDVDFCALKIDDGFVTNQWQMFPWVFFLMNLNHIGDLILFAHQFCRYVEHFLQGEICCIQNRILIVLEILSHECRCIHPRSHKHSPNYWMFLSWACNVGHATKC